MKKQLLVSLISLMAVAGAQATSIKPTSQAHLDHVILDPKHEQFGGALSADVTIDHIQDMIRLDVHVIRPLAPCAIDRPCPPAGPETVELPIYSRYEDRCGSYHWDAQTAEIIPGATVERLLVTDNRGNRCPHFVALPATDVRYVTDAPYPGYGGPYTSIFSGSALR